MSSSKNEHELDAENDNDGENDEDEDEKGEENDSRLELELELEEEVKGDVDETTPLKCPMCNEIFVEPKFLSCIHTFCLSCLDKCSERKDDHLHISCYLCQRLTQVSSFSCSLLRSGHVYSLRDLIVGDVAQ